MTFDDAFDRFSRHLLPDGMPASLARRLRPLASLENLSRRKMTTLDAQREHFVFIAAGSTKLVALDADQSEQIVDFQFGGDCLHLPQAGLHDYRLIAMRNARLLVFDAEAMRAIACDTPMLAEAMARCTLSALHRARENLVTMGRRSATERVASFLLSMREIEQVTEDGGRSLTLVMTRKEIADCLGLTVETVSRQFTKLRDLGLIATPSRTLVRLHDPARLAAEAGSLAA